MIGFSGSGPTLTGLLVLSTVLHGACYDFIMIAASLFVDTALDVTVRARAQVFPTVATMGLGILAGSVIADLVYAAATITPHLHDWRTVWAAPDLIAAIRLVLFFYSLRGRHSASIKQAGQ